MPAGIGKIETRTFSLSNTDKVIQPTLLARSTPMKSNKQEYVSLISDDDYSWAIDGRGSEVAL